MAIATPITLAGGVKAQRKPPVPMRASSFRTPSAAFSAFQNMTKALVTAQKAEIELAQSIQQDILSRNFADDAETAMDEVHYSADQAAGASISGPLDSALVFAAKIIAHGLKLESIDDRVAFIQLVSTTGTARPAEIQGADLRLVDKMIAEALSRMHLLLRLQCLDEPALGNELNGFHDSEASYAA